MPAEVHVRVSDGKIVDTCDLSLEALAALRLYAAAAAAAAATATAGGAAAAAAGCCLFALQTSLLFNLARHFPLF